MEVHPMALNTKLTVIRSVTAVACTAAICITASSSAGRYADAVVERAGYRSGVSVSSQDGGTGGDYSDDSTFIPEDNVSPADDISAPDDSQAQEGDTSAAASENTTGNGSSSAAAESNDPTKYSVAQIVNYYNTSLKTTYNLPKLTIEKTEDIDIVIDEVHPGGDLFTKLGNKIIDKYAKATTSTGTFAKGQSTTGGDDAQEFSMHANLEPAGVKTASVKKVGSGYEINILLKPEQATLQNRPKYNSQCANPLDLGSVDLFGLQITQADFNYPGTTLKAVVDSQGRVTSAVCNMQMNGTGAGKLGLTGSATVHGGMIKSAKFIF